MENIERLQPRAFTKFCMSIGMVPSSYTTALTYEEQLLWFCSYLEKEVIPAVNNNAEAVTELQGLYTQLKDYVDHYFENLDVQEEINNKLDEMAESGELTDIIAQYLQLAGVLAYDTKTAMKTATNLVNGSIAKTLGSSTFKDGKGEFYKVREVLNTDDIDDENIIALADENLVAEKVPNNFIKITTNMNADEIVRLIELDIPKIVVFETGEYTLTNALHIPNNCIIDLNGSTITFDFEGEAIGIYGYKFDDTFTGFNGNEFTIKNGTLDHCSIALMHNINVKIENIEFIGATDTFHIIQIAGCKDTTIKDCIFNGVAKVDETSESNYISHEIINIDPTIYGAQPYMEETSVMYDNTINEGIYIINNIFNKGDDIDTKCYVCIGSHANIEDYPIYSKHIIIKDNKFNYALYSCLQFVEMEDVEISNNYYNGYGARNTVTFLMTRITDKDFRVINNKVENVCEFYRTASLTSGYFVEDVIIKNNDIQNACETINAEATFMVRYSKNTIIRENNVKCNGICLSIGDYVTNTDFIENSVISSVTSNIPIKLYGVSSNGSRVIGNNITALSNNSYCIAVDQQTDYIISNNTYSNKLLFLATAKVTKNVYNNSAIYDLTDIMNNTTGSDITPKGTLANFKSLKVLLGSGSNCCVVDLLPFLHNGEYIDSRVMSGSYVNDNNSFGYIKVTTDTTNNKLSFTSSSLGVRRIYATD